MPSEKIAAGYCQCGCGEYIGFWTFTDRKNNKVKGEPRRFVKGHNAYSGLSVRERFDTYVEQPDGNGCWNWTGRKDDKGYGQFQIMSKRQERSHRLAFKFENGQIPPGLIVRHKCDNPSCVNPSHLELGTVQDNVMDRNLRQRGRYRYIPDSEIRDMRVDYDGGMKKAAIARKYGVSKTTAGRIINGDGRYALIS